jgi:hypothetical protein
MPRIYGGQHRDPHRRTRRLRALAVVAVILSLFGGWIVVRTFAPGLGSSPNEGSVGSVGASASTELLARAEALLVENPQLALRLDIAAVALGDGREATERLQAHLTSLGQARLGQPTLRIPLGEDATAIALRPDRGLLAAGLGTSTVTLIPPDSPDERTVLADGPDSPVTALRFNPNGDVLAVGYGSGQIALFGVGDLRNIVLATTQTLGNGAVSSISFSSDGTLLAAAGAAGTGILWDISSPAEPVQRDAVAARSLAITGNGSLLVTGSPDGLSLFRIGDTGLTRQDDLVTAGDVAQVAADARERAVVTVSAGGAGAVWDLSGEETPTVAARLDVPGGVLEQVAMAEDSPLLVGVHSRGMELWGLDRPRDPTELATVGTEQTSSILGGFSADGTWLLTATGDEALIWDGVAWFSPGTDAVVHACGLADGGLPPAQWQEYVPQIAYRNTCVY